MSQVFTTSLIVLITTLCTTTALAQRQLKYKTYHQNNFEDNKIFDEVYNLRWNKELYLNFSKMKDTLAYFVDDRNYKGIINYGITFKSKTHKNFRFSENNGIGFLKVEISKCVYTPKDSLIHIEGFLSSNCYNLIYNKEKPSHFNIFIGAKTDTLYVRYVDILFNRKKIEVKWNNKEIDDYAVLDTFPAFYFKKYSYSKTSIKGRNPFKISGKVAKNTLLAFGSRAYFAEIFDLGSMVYAPEKNKGKRKAKKELPEMKTLMIDNKLVADIEKEKAQKGEITYYTYTEKAENYIFARQYARAKEEYNTLSQKYPVLFARDIHNAIRCAILSRDLKTAFGWSEKLALKGVELPYFNAKIFTSMRKNPEWKNFSTKYDSICKGAQGHWNLRLLKELDDLLQEDQAVYGLENRKNPKVLYETTERVTDKLIDLLKKEGYPSEEKTGCHVVNDTTLLSFPDFNVLMLHAEQQKTKNLNILKELLDQSSNAMEYDRKRDFNSDTGYNSCFHIYKGNLYILKSYERNDAEIRKLRFKFSNPNGFIMDYNNFVIE
ncbi:hypothetical protein GJU43_21940, partial [Flavobacterium sp. LC2016-23]|uniref:hypothetical protein n=1 Tax=Flavobacterium sp. LC2016-23 TaxID=2666330 RepID=UPI0012AF7C8D